MSDKNLTWANILNEEKQEKYFQDILELLKTESSKGKVIYPRSSDIFKAFTLTPFEDLKVVILGQDPYHGPGQAEGLSFSVPPGVRLPPSLQNIFKELVADVGITNKNNGHLESWAKQGVFLLNSVLTVESGNPASHASIGWERFTDTVIQKISQNKSGVVFLLWGNFAKSKRILIDETKHTVLLAAHPSPFSAYNGFFGCKHFSKTNEILKKGGVKEIDWEIKS